MQMASRFLPRLRLHPERAMAFVLHFHLGVAILQAVPDRALIVDLVRQRTDSAWRTRSCFLLFREKAMADFRAVDLFPVTELDFRRASTVDFSATRFWPVAGSICPGSLCSGYSLIGFAIAPAGSAVVVAAGFGFDLCRNCPAIAIAAGPGSARRRRSVVDSCLFCFAVAAAALVFVSDVVSIAQSSF